MKIYMAVRNGRFKFIDANSEAEAADIALYTHGMQNAMIRLLDGAEYIHGIDTKDESINYDTPLEVGTQVYVLRKDDFEGRVGIIDTEFTYDGEYLVRFENPYRPSRWYPQSELEVAYPPAL